MSSHPAHTPRNIENPAKQVASARRERRIDRRDDPRKANLTEENDSKSLKKPKTDTSVTKDMVDKIDKVIARRSKTEAESSDHAREVEDTVMKDQDSKFQ